MNLFIETPQRAAERASRERARQIEELRMLTAQQASMGRAAFSPSEPLAQGGVASYRVEDMGWSAPRADATGSFAQPAFASATPVADAAEYERERKESRRRTRARRVGRVVRSVLLILLVPVLLAVVFVAAYALTCIMNGASPGELMGLLGSMAEKVAAFAAEAL